jgi:hypothetical protein
LAVFGRCGRLVSLEIVGREVNKAFLAEMPREEHLPLGVGCFGNPLREIVAKPLGFDRGWEAGSAAGADQEDHYVAGFDIIP